MNLDLNLDQIAIKTEPNNAKVQRQIQKSFKIHDFRQKNNQLTYLNPICIRKSNRSEEQRISMRKSLRKNPYCAEYNQNAARSEAQSELPSFCISLKGSEYPSNELLIGKSQQIDEERIHQKSNRSPLSPKKERNIDFFSSKRKHLKANARQKKRTIFISKHNYLQINKSSSSCIDRMIKLNKLTQQLSRVQIDAGQKSKTQQLKRVSFIQIDDLKIPQTRLSELKRRSKQLQQLRELKKNINHRSFSPVNFKYKKFLGPLNHQSINKNSNSKEKMQYLQINGQIKVINQNDQIKSKRKILLSKLEKEK